MPWGSSGTGAWGAPPPPPQSKITRPATVKKRKYFLPEEIEQASKTRTIVKEFDGITVKVFRTQANELMVSLTGLKTAPGVTIGCGPATLDVLVRLIVRGDKSRSETW